MERITRKDLERRLARLCRATGRTLLLDHRSVPGNPYTWTVLEPEGREYALESRYYTARELNAVLGACCRIVEDLNREARRAHPSALTKLRTRINDAVRDGRLPQWAGYEDINSPASYDISPVSYVVRPDEIVVSRIYEPRLEALAERTLIELCDQDPATSHLQIIFETVTERIAQ